MINKKAERQNRKDQFKKMFEGGMTYQEIADTHGVSRQRVHQVIREYDTVKPAIAKKYKKDSCELCGTTERLTIHHKDKNWRNNDPNNLQTVCFPCHKKNEPMGEVRKNYPIPSYILTRCSICDKDFLHPACIDRVTCSTACGGAERSLNRPLKMYTKTCPFCSSEYETRYDHQVFCSRSCHLKNVWKKSRTL